LQSELDSHLAYRPINCEFSWATRAS
jgi:hypothetical protein